MYRLGSELKQVGIYSVLKYLVDIYSVLKFWDRRGDILKCHSKPE